MADDRRFGPHAGGGYGSWRSPRRWTPLPHEGSCGAGRNWPTGAAGAPSQSSSSGRGPSQPLVRKPAFPSARTRTRWGGSAEQVVVASRLLGNEDRRQPLPQHGQEREQAEQRAGLAPEADEVPLRRLPARQAPRPKAPSDPGRRGETDQGREADQDTRDESRLAGQGDRDRGDGIDEAEMGRPDQRPAQQPRSEEHT